MYNRFAMKEIHTWLNESMYTKPLSPACKMCAQGSKMVVLITGLCSTGCYYCPLSLKKGGNDRIFADEWELKNESDTKKLVHEAEYINAIGAGITGGDPLIVWKRTKTYISLLKDTFGSEFHIHLYTSGLKNAEKIQQLVSAGLDEIRFHPMPEHWQNMEKSPIKQSIKKTVGASVDVAIEIPVIPNMEKEIFSLIQWADDQKLCWVNLNELEFSERNVEAFHNKGYVVKDDISAAVRGSQDTALNVLKLVQQEDIDVGVHYCSVSFKDGVQLRNRIKRRAKNIAKEFEVITDDGTILKGVIYKSNVSLPQLFLFLKNEYDIPEKFLFIDKEKNRIEIGLWILEEIADDITRKGYKCFMVEEYPTSDRLEVERSPLPL